MYHGLVTCSECTGEPLLAFASPCVDNLMLGLGAAPLGAQSGNAPFLANFNFTPSDATKAEAARIDAEERARRETAERQEYVPPADDGRREYAPPRPSSRPTA